MTIHIGLLLFPDVQQLDVIGPHDMLTGLPGVQTHMVWKDLSPIKTSAGLQMIPDTTFASCPRLDVIVVPGGGGVNTLITDAEVIAFLRSAARGARFVTSVCTGSLLLAVAGLLDGRKATSHWRYIDLLAHAGAVPTKGRIVTDREGAYTVMSGGGVTAGIDFALALAAELVGEDAAMAKQLYIEYDPAPPFKAGHPDSAPAHIVEGALKATDLSVEGRKEAIAQGLKVTQALAKEGK